MNKNNFTIRSNPLFQLIPANVDQMNQVLPWTRSGIANIRPAGHIVTLFRIKYYTIYLKIVSVLNFLTIANYQVSVHHRINGIKYLTTQ